MGTERTGAEIETREQFLADAREFTPYVAVNVGDELFFVSTEDTGVGRRVFVRGRRKDMTTLVRGLAELADRGFGRRPTRCSSRSARTWARPP